MKTFNLSAAPAPAREVDLAGGVSMVLNPWSGLRAASAEMILAAEREAILAGMGAALWGFEAADGDFDDAETFNGVWFLIAAAVRASVRAERWNLTREDGEPMPLTRYMIARLFHRGVNGDGAGGVHLTAFLKAEEV